MEDTEGSGCEYKSLTKYSSQITFSRYGTLRSFTIMKSVNRENFTLLWKTLSC